MYDGSDNPRLRMIRDDVLDLDVLLMFTMREGEDRTYVAEFEYNEVHLGTKEDSVFKAMALLLGRME